MLVDPSTGLPMDSPDANTMLGQVGINAANGVGYEQGALINMLSALPSATTTTGWNAWRGSNTLLHGGYRPEGRGLRSIGSHTHPRSFRRFSNISSIDPKGEQYTPFNFLAWSGNKIGNSARVRGGAARIQKLLPQGMRGPAINTGTRGKDVEYFSRGTLTRLSTAGRLAGASAETRMNAMSNLMKLNPEMSMIISRGEVEVGRNASVAMAASAGGRYSQFVGGYMFGSGSEQMTKELAARESKQYFMKGAAKSAEHLAMGGVTRDAATGALKFASQAGEKVGMAAVRAGAEVAAKEGTMALAKFGLGAAAHGLGMALPGINVIMTAQMIYDAAKLTSIATVAALDFGKEAATSFKGSISKPVMGMGFKDNEVAATSRARGVSAIQNSRLNARSVLGNEASGLAAHFG